MSRRRGASPHDPTARRAMFEEVPSDDLMEHLSPQEAGVISMRFGLTDGLPRTLDEVGRIYGVTRERIRQIEDKAMRKLRKVPLDRFGVRAEGDKGELVDLIDVRGTFAPERAEPILMACEFCFQLRQVGVTLTTPQSEEPLTWSYGTRTHGRPRKYCSNKCRQAAYRIRKAQTMRRREGA